MLHLQVGHTAVAIVASLLNLNFQTQIVFYNVLCFFHMWPFESFKSPKNGTSLAWLKLLHKKIRHSEEPCFVDDFFGVANLQNSWKVLG